MRMLALGLDNGRVMMVDEATGEEKWSIQAHSPSSPVHVAMSPNGRFVACVGFNDNHHCWKILFAASGELHREVATHVAPNDPDGFLMGMGLRAVAFSPCGQRLATAGDSVNGTVVLWDPRTGEADHRMQEDNGDAWTIAFTTDGARVAISRSDVKVIDVFDATTGAWFRTIHVNDWIESMSFSPTAISILATAGENHEIRVWNIESGEMIREIKGCSMVAIFSPDGRTIASASADGARDVQLMDAESGALRSRMVGHTSFVSTASWSLDGSKLATGSGDGASGSGDVTCKVWDSSTGALLLSIDAGRPVASVVWGRDWVREQGAMAFAMGHHLRLGVESQVLALEEGVVRMILDRV